MASSGSRMVRHSLKMMVGTFLSRILGLAREVLIAAFFGASGRLDAFLVAYTLANLSRRLLAEGALSAAFIPVFSQSLERSGQQKANRLARETFTFLLGAAGLLVAVGLVLAPWLVAVLAPGFTGENALLATSLTRTMLPFMLFISVAALAMGILNSMGCFFVPAVAPALSNVIFILLVLILAPTAGINSLAVAVLAGGAAQCLLQWFWTKKYGMTLLPVIPDRKNEELKRVLRLFLPYAAGLSLNQLIPVFSRVLGSFLQEGSISVLNYADRILQLPLGLFVVAISQAILPLLARQVLEGEDAFRQGIEDALKFAMFIVLPVTAGLVLFSTEIVHLLFVRGAFGEWAWHATSKTLSMFALGLPGMASMNVLLRALHARGLPREAMYVAASSVITYFLFGALLMRPLAYAGLALGAACSFTTSAFFAGFLLRRRCGLASPFSFKWLKPVAGGIVSMVAAVGMLKVVLPYPEEMNILARSGWMCLPIALGGIVYGAVTWKAGCGEWEWLREVFTRKVHREEDGENKKELKNS
ncbi:MAG: murein biosynthesis integral membrane protein MurJ [Thermovirgaceae bacterium]